MSELFDMATQIVRAHVSAVQEGIRCAERHHEAKVRALLAAYERALLDPSARIPTALHAACEAFRDFRGSDRDAEEQDKRRQYPEGGA